MTRCRSRFRLTGIFKVITVGVIVHVYSSLCGVGVVGLSIGFGVTRGSRNQLITLEDELLDDLLCSSHHLAGNDQDQRYDTEQPNDVKGDECGCRRLHRVLGSSGLRDESLVHD